MEERVEQFVQADSQRFPLGPPKFFSYGTAGFRDRQVSEFVVQLACPEAEAENDC